MKQVFLNLKNGDIELKEVPTCLVKQGFVLIKNHYSLLSSGTERSAIEMGRKSLIEKARARPDLVRKVIEKVKTEGILNAYHKTKQKLEELLALGYSSSGEVIAVGKGVEGFEIGDKVACAGQGYASHAEIVCVPKNLCVKVPKEISLETAALTTIGAIAIQGIRRANLKLGEKTGVIGLGIIGQLTVQILKAYGFPVIGFDVDEKQVKLIDKGGIIGKHDIEELVKDFTDNVGLDAVIITAATKSNKPIELAGKILRERGRVSIVGDIGMDIPRRIYYKKELDVFVSRSYGPGRYDKNYEEKGNDYPLGFVRWTEKRNMEEFLRLADKIKTDNLISHRFNIEQAKQAYSLVLKEKTLGILFSYNIEKQHNDIVFLEKEYKGKGKINVGVIGAGNFAQSMLLPNLRGVNVYAIADADAGKAVSIAKKYKAKYATSDYQKIIADKDIDLVIVATRHDLHAKIAKQALENNKNVHIEKPLALNEQDFEEIIKKAQASQGRLFMGFNRRFAPFALKAKELLDNPLIMLYRINAGFIPKDNWIHDPKEGGGRIIGEVCHFVDLLQFLANSPPKRVFATLVPVSGSVIAEDNVIVTIDFENGARGVILYTALGNEKLGKEYLEIYGESKTIVIDDFKRMQVFSKKGKSIKIMAQDKGHRNELKKFVEAIQEGKDSPIPLKEIFYSTQAVFAIIKSIKQGKPIDL